MLEIKMTKIKNGLKLQVLYNINNKVQFVSISILHMHTSIIYSHDHDDDDEVKVKVTTTTVACMHDLMTTYL